MSNEKPQSPLRRSIGDFAPKIVEMITHLAFYVGWPNAMSAVNKAKALFETA
jgi:4-carboxymuconolactone decarboxylase